MKNKIFRLMGIALIVTILASLFAIPIPVAAGTDEFSKLSIKAAGATGGYFRDATITAIGRIVADKAGTLYAYANPGGVVDELLKSTDGGRTWAKTDYSTPTLGAGQVGTSGPIVDIAISNLDANVIYVVDTANRVWKTTNGGTVFTEVTTATNPITAGASAATSIDIGYSGTNVVIFVGTTAALAADRGVFIMTDTTPGFGAPAPTFGKLGALADNVFDMVVSPDFGTTQHVVAVTSTAVPNIEVRYFAPGGWSATLATLVAAAGIGAGGSASIGLPDNYVGTIGNAAQELLVGINDVAGANGGVYRVLANAAAVVFGGATIDVTSVDVFGNVGGYSVLAGRTGGMVARSTDGVAASWLSNSATSGKDPAGAGNATVVMAPDFPQSQKAWAAVGGVEGGVSLTMDGGKTFNQISLIDATFTTVLAQAVSSTYATDKIAYILTTDVTTNESVWRFDGTFWSRTIVSTQAFQTTGGDLDRIAISPLGDAVFLADATGALGIYRSIDGGNAFARQATAPAAINSWAIISKDHLIVGGANDVFRTTTNGAFPGYTAATTKPAAATPANGAVTSIVASPAFTTDNTLILGNGNGEVWRSTDAGDKWTLVDEVTGAPAAGATFVAFHPNYASNATIFGASLAQIDRFVLSPTPITRSKLLDAATDNDTITGGAQLADGQVNPVVAGTTFSGLAVSADGTIYAIANDGTVIGVLRSLDPLAGTATPDVAAMWESVNKASTADAPVVALMGLVLTPGSVMVWASGATDVWTYTDNFNIPVALVAPADNAALGTTTTPTISWTPVSGATSYTVQWATREDMAGAVSAALAPLTASETNATFGTTPGFVALTANTKYWWRVRVTANSPVLSRWSDKRTFLTALTAPVAPPAMVPAQGATGVSTAPALSWGPVAGATGYEIQLAQKSDFSDAVTKSTTSTAYAWTDALDNDKVYYWRVRATTATGQSAWVTGVFTTAAKPVPPVTPTFTVTVPAPTAPPVTVTATAPAPPAPPASTIILPPPAPVTVTAPAPPAPAPVTVTAPPPIVNLPAQATPGYVWAIIAIGAVLVIAVIVLIVRTRRVS